jgi:2-methylisocitrate lyase-like PEP mutase family enzyme
MSNTPELGQRRKINWLNLNTVMSAAVLIGAEVFGAAYAGGWAIAMLLGLGDLGIISLRVLLFAGGLAVMASFIRQASRVEPFVTRQ